MNPKVWAKVIGAREPIGLFGYTYRTYEEALEARAAADRTGWAGSAIFREPDGRYTLIVAALRNPRDLVYVSASTEMLMGRVAQYIRGFAVAQETHRAMDAAWSTFTALSASLGEQFDLDWYAPANHEIEESAGRRAMQRTALELAAISERGTLTALDEDELRRGVVAAASDSDQAQMLAAYQAEFFARVQLGMKLDPEGARQLARAFNVREGDVRALAEALMRAMIGRDITDYFAAVTMVRPEVIGTVPGLSGVFGDTVMSDRFRRYAQDYEKFLAAVGADRAARAVSDLWAGLLNLELSGGEPFYAVSAMQRASIYMMVSSIESPAASNTHAASILTTIASWMFDHESAESWARELRAEVSADPSLAAMLDPAVLRYAADMIQGFVGNVDPTDDPEAQQIAFELDRLARTLDEALRLGPVGFGARYRRFWDWHELRLKTYASATFASSLLAHSYDHRSSWVARSMGAVWWRYLYGHVVPWGDYYTGLPLRAAAIDPVVEGAYRLAYRTPKALYERDIKEALIQMRATADAFSDFPLPAETYFREPPEEVFRQALQYLRDYGSPEDAALAEQAELLDQALKAASALKVVVPRQERDIKWDVVNRANQVANEQLWKAEVEGLVDEAGRDEEAERRIREHLRMFSITHPYAGPKLLPRVMRYMVTGARPKALPGDLATKYYEALPKDSPIRRFADEHPILFTIGAEMGPEVGISMGLGAAARLPGTVGKVARVVSVMDTARHVPGMLIGDQYNLLGMAGGTLLERLSRPLVRGTSRLGRAAGAVTESAARAGRTVAEVTTPLVSEALMQPTLFSPSEGYRPPVAAARRREDVER